MLAQQIVNGLSLGMIYALIAVGYSLVFGILRLVNMSHGAVYAFGAHMALVCVGLRWGFAAALLVSCALTGLVNVLFDSFILAPLREKNASSITALITTVGFSYVAQNLLMIVFGSERKSFPKVFDFGVIEVLGVRFNSTQIIVLIISIVMMLGLTFLIHCTAMGLAMRGVEQNGRAALLVGVNVRGVVTFTFALSGVSAAIASFMVAGYYNSVYANMGSQISLKAFAASVVGGIGVLHGSVVGGLIVGLSESFAVTFLSGAYRDATAFVILFFVLIIRPNGIFGKKETIKV
jgi:branched-chain amino acid transport system permease protein